MLYATGLEKVQDFSRLQVVVDEGEETFGLSNIILGQGEKSTFK